MKINRPEIFVGKTKATKHVLHLAKSLNIAVPKAKKYNTDIMLDGGTKQFRINFHEEIERTRLTGRANMLQVWYDSEDHFLQPALEISLLNSVPGIQISLGANIGNYSNSIKAPAMIEDPQMALSRDICFYHHQACVSYNAEDISEFLRNYRGFLHSCVSLVDSFLYKYLFHVKEFVGDTSKFSNTMVLDSRRSIEDRLQAWIETFAATEIEGFKNWNERSHFLELKKKRNEYTHPSNPSVAYSPNEVVKFLNYGASGVGKLLGRMRKASGLTDKIGFIHQLSNLPKITIKK